MKQLLPLLLVVFIINSCTNSSRDAGALNKHYFIEMNLKGYIDSVVDLMYDTATVNGVLTPGENQGTSTYIFDSAGFLIEETDFYKSDSQHVKLLFTIKDNNVTMAKCYKEREGYAYTIFYNYKNGSLNELVYKSIDDRTTMRVETKTTNKGIVVERTTYGGDGLKFGTTKNDIKDNNVIATTNYDSSGKVTDKTVISYNKNNDPEQDTFTNGDTVAVTKMKYYYDEHNNWIKRELFRGNNIPESIIVRKIYYSK